MSLLTKNSLKKINLQLLHERVFFFLKLPKIEMVYSIELDSRSFDVVSIQSGSSEKMKQKLCFLKEAMTKQIL